MKVVYRFKGNPVEVSHQAEGRDEYTRLKVRLEKAAKQPARDRGSYTMTGAPRAYTRGQEKRAFESQFRDKIKCDERTCRQMLEGSEKKLGKHHPETLELMQNLVDVLRSQGKFTEAEHELRVLHMRRRMRESETPKRKAQFNDTYGTGANPSILFRKVPVKQVPQRSKPGLAASSTDSVSSPVSMDTPKPHFHSNISTSGFSTPKPPSRPRPQSARRTGRTETVSSPVATETPTPPSRPRPQSAPSRRGRQPPAAKSSGTPQSPPSEHCVDDGESKRPGESSLKSSKEQASAQVAEETKPGERQDDEKTYRELRACLVEQMAESCIHRGKPRTLPFSAISTRIHGCTHGESQMVKLLRETRARAFQMSEELGVDPARCAEAIRKLETDLGLDTQRHSDSGPWPCK